MKKNIIAFEAIEFAGTLSNEEMISINGGSNAWEDLAYIAGRTIRCIWEFSKGAIEYQHSLPANLKK
ncbi:MAG: hypothetical protein Q8K64_16430 [Sediminibacterium sp.]|nr:hypothetical protein [Sediminibacterium sp.]